MDCLFCSIANGDVSANISFANQQLLAFSDINPQAPHHLLIIPRKHIATLNELASMDTTLLGEMIQTAQSLAQSLHMAEAGYRLVMNCNADGGQAVYHIHLHLLGGRAMTWPPG